MNANIIAIANPFGTIKWYDGAHYFLCRGKEKVSAKASLMFLSYDIRRAISLVGVAGLEPASVAAMDFKSIVYAFPPHAHAQQIIYLTRRKSQACGAASAPFVK